MTARGELPAHDGWLPPGTTDADIDRAANEGVVRHCWTCEHTGLVVLDADGRVIAVGEQEGAVECPDCGGTGEEE